MNTGTFIYQTARVALVHREPGDYITIPADARPARQRYYEEHHRARRQRFDAEQAKQASVDIYRTGWRCQDCDAPLLGPEDGCAC